MYFWNYFTSNNDSKQQQSCGNVNVRNKAQLLKNCHDVLLKLLLSAEYFALGKSNKKIYGKNGAYDNISNKTILELKYQFVEDLHSYNGILAAYSRYYPGQFYLPNGLDKQKIINYIKLWKGQFIDKPERKYYDMLLKLIDGKKIEDLYDEMEKIDHEIKNEEKKHPQNMIVDSEENKGQKEGDGRQNLVNYNNFCDKQEAFVYPNQSEIEGRKNQCQTQCQLRLQKISLQQAQKLKNCHDVLLRLLFSAENFALGKSKNKIFGEYDAYDNTSNKTILELKYQFVEELDSYNGILAAYSRYYPGQFYLPNGLDKQKIINYIKLWKGQFIDKPERKYYDMLLKLIDGKKIEDLYDEMEKIDHEIKNEEKKHPCIKNEEGKRKKAEDGIQNFVDNYAEAYYNIDKDLEKVDKYYDKKSGEYTFKVKFGGAPGKGIRDFK